MTAVASSSDDDMPLASKVPDVKIKDETGIDEKKEVGALDEKKSTPGSAKAKSTGKKKTATVKKPASSSKQASNTKSGKKVDESKVSDEKKPRKVYDMPGQTRDTPAEEDPQRRFYTSLLEQVPSSEMAKKWCVIHGLLPIEEAKKWVAKNGKKAASAPAAKRSKTSAAKKPKAASTKGSKKAATGKAGPKKVKKKASKVTYKEDPSDSDEEVVPAKRLRVVRKSKVPSSSPIAKYKDTLHFSDSDSDVPIAQKVGS